MHENQNLTFGRVARVLEERLRPAIYSQPHPLDIASHAVGGEPIPVEDGLAAVYEPIGVGAWWGRAWDTTWLRITGTVPAEFTGPVSIPITAQSGPPDATQNSSIDRLDTLDGRFVNGSLQIGNLLYQVNSTALGSFAAVRWYKLDTSTNTAIKQCTVFASGTSHDFNPSIAANGSGDVFLNWSASKVSATANVEARAAGAEATDLTATCPAMTQVVYGSGPEYGNGNATSEVLRWGDYSSVYLKFNTKRALVVNQLVAASGGTGVGTTWTSKIAQIQFA